MLAFLGLVVGVINGVLFTIAIAKNLFEIEPVYPIPILSLYIAGVFIISIIAGVLPGYKVSKITPSEALRYTG